MTDPIRAALDRLNDRLLPTLFGEGVSAAFLQAWTNEARAALAARPPADDDHDRAALEGLLERVHLAATDPAVWLGLKQGERHPLEPAPAIDFAIQVTDEAAYLFRLGSALDRLIYYVHTLAGYSEGVVGLHQNGDLAPWPSLLEGGEFSHWLGDAIAAGRAALAAASPADAQPPEPAPAIDKDQLVAELISAQEYRSQKQVAYDIASDSLHPAVRVIRQPAHPPAPAASTPLDLDALLGPEGAYERGTGQEDGAQLVSGPHGPEWWIPQYGCDSLDNLLDRLRTRILPHLRPPVAGVDVPGGDGDYGNVMDLCAAEGVDVRIGAPLLRRARDAWKVATPTPAANPRPRLDADTLQKVWREAVWGERWATLVDYIALAVEAQRAPSGNPPATEEDLAEARQEVAGFDNELLQMALRHLALVQARDGREYSAALCERAAELIPPASDGEREELALLLIDDAECLEAEQPDRMAMTNQQMRRSATLFHQPAPAAVPVAVDGWLPISTAPKDGTDILASDYDSIDIVSWENPPEEPPGWIDRYDQYMHPSWWKPLGDHPPLPTHQPPQGGEVA